MNKYNSLQFAYSVLGQDIANPILVSSSSLTDSDKNIRNFLELGVGGVISKTIYIGSINFDNERVIKFGDNLFNTTGYSHHGSDEWLQFFKKYNEEMLPVFPNVYGETADKTVNYIKRLEAVGCKFVELGISCPNDEKGYDMNTVKKMLYRIKLKTKMKVSIKLTATADIQHYVKEMIEYGADAITISDTIPSVHFRDGQKVCAGYSGKAIKPIVLHSIQKIKEIDSNFPVLGVGGIQSPADVMDYLTMGVSAVQICSMIYHYGTQSLKELLMNLVENNEISVDSM